MKAVCPPFSFFDNFDRRGFPVSSDRYCCPGTAARGGGDFSAGSRSGSARETDEKSAPQRAGSS